MRTWLKNVGQRKDVAQPTAFLPFLRNPIFSLELKPRSIVEIAY